MKWFFKPTIARYALQVPDGEDIISSFSNNLIIIIWKWISIILQFAQNSNSSSCWIAFGRLGEIHTQWMLLFQNFSIFEDQQANLIFVRWWAVDGYFCVFSDEMKHADYLSLVTTKVIINWNYSITKIIFRDNLGQMFISVNLDLTRNFNLFA